MINTNSLILNKFLICLCMHSETINLEFSNYTKLLKFQINLIF